MTPTTTAASAGGTAASRNAQLGPYDWTTRPAGAEPAAAPDRNATESTANVWVTAPAGAVTQTFAGLAVALLGGSAVGSALAGQVVQAQGPAVAFLLGGVPPVLAAVVVGVTIARRAAVPTAAG